MNKSTQWPPTLSHFIKSCTPTWKTGFLQQKTAGVVTRCTTEGDIHVLWGRKRVPPRGMDGMTHTQDSLHYLHKEQHKLCKPSQESKKRQWRWWCKGGEYRCVVSTWCKRQVIYLLHCCRLSKWELSAGSYRRTSFQLKWSEQKTNNKQFCQKVAEVSKEGQPGVE